MGLGGCGGIAGRSRERRLVSSRVESSSSSCLTETSSFLYSYLWRDLAIEGDSPVYSFPWFDPS